MMILEHASRSYKYVISILILFITIFVYIFINIALIFFQFLFHYHISNLCHIMSNLCHVINYTILGKMSKKHISKTKNMKLEHNLIFLQYSN